MLMTKPIIIPALAPYLQIYSAIWVRESEVLKSDHYSGFMPYTTRLGIPSADLPSYGFGDRRHDQDKGRNQIEREKNLTHKGK